MFVGLGRGGAGRRSACSPWFGAGTARVAGDIPAAGVRQPSVFGLLTHAACQRVLALGRSRRRHLRVSTTRQRPGVRGGDAPARRSEPCRGAPAALGGDPAVHPPADRAPHRQRAEAAQVLRISAARPGLGRVCWPSSSCRRWCTAATRSATAGIRTTCSASRRRRSGPTCSACARRTPELQRELRRRAATPRSRRPRASSLASSSRATRPIQIVGPPGAQAAGAGRATRAAAGRAADHASRSRPGSASSMASSDADPVASSAERGCATASSGHVCCAAVRPSWWRSPAARTRCACSTRWWPCGPGIAAASWSATSIIGCATTRQLTPPRREPSRRGTACAARPCSVDVRALAPR